MSLDPEVLGPTRIVLGDANVLYSRVLRDYLVYAADQGVISIRWSRAILNEVVKHLQANNSTFHTHLPRRREVLNRKATEDTHRLASLKDLGDHGRLASHGLGLGSGHGFALEALAQQAGVNGRAGISRSRDRVTEANRSGNPVQELK